MTIGAPEDPERENIGPGRPREAEPMHKLLAAVVMTCLALLVAVVTVGLWRDNLDPTGVATVLSTLISGIVVGTLVRRKDPPS